MFIFERGEELEERRMAVTRSIEQIVRDEVTRAIEEHAENITRSNADQIFKYTIHKSKVTWVVQCCTVCRKPNFVHQDLWDANCTAEPINQTTKGEYIDQLENHRRIKQIAKRIKPVKEQEEDEVQEGPQNPRLAKSRGDEKWNQKHKTKSFMDENQQPRQQHQKKLTFQQQQLAYQQLYIELEKQLADQQQRQVELLRQEDGYARRKDEDGDEYKD